MDYRCDGCGKVFKSSQGLASHQRYCRKVPTQVGKNAPDLANQMQALTARLAALESRNRTLEDQVAFLMQSVAPGGKNLVGVLSAQVVELRHALSQLEGG